MSKVRIIVKRTYQPPIDTPASIRWATVEVENEELFQMLLAATDDTKGDARYTSSTVVGAEPIIDAAIKSAKGE